jgi:hypothetical protein
MSSEKRSKGKCAYCGQEIDKSATTKHLAVCAQRQETIAKADKNNKNGRTEMLFHLRAESVNSGQFWLDLEMRGLSMLRDLDSYLRAIWLECCGHMSRFSIGGWGSSEISKKRRADEIFEQGIKLTHIYDFGTTSETLIKCVGVREGKATTPRPIAIMTRNLMPECKCVECKKPAIWMCMECLIEEDEWKTLCDDHAKTHPHDNYGEPVKLVNSPRLGLCGYDGLAEPPY